MQPAKQRMRPWMHSRMRANSRRSDGLAAQAAGPFYFKDIDALLIEIVLLGNRTMEAELRSAAEKGTTDTEKLLAVFLAETNFAAGHAELLR